METPNDTASMSISSSHTIPGVGNTIRIIGAVRAAETVRETANRAGRGANHAPIPSTNHATNSAYISVDLAHELDDHTDDAVWIELERMLIARESARAAHPAGAFR